MRPPEPKGPGRRPFILWNPNVTNKAAITEIQHRLWYMDMGSQDSGGREGGRKASVDWFRLVEERKHVHVSQMRHAKDVKTLG